MSVSLAMSLSLIYVAILFAVTFYNYQKRQQTAFISSLFALGMFVIAHLGNSLWLMSLSVEETLATHYLFFAGVQAVIAGGLFYINRKEMRVIVFITIILLVVEAMLGYAVHIDRNIIALNGMASPNASLEASWFLWELRNWISQITSTAVLLALTLPRVYQVTSNDNTFAYKILEAVEKYLEGFKKKSKIKLQAQAYMNLGAQALCELTGERKKDVHYHEIGIELLNKGIQKCCYEPGKTKPVSIVGRFVYWLRS